MSSQRETYRGQKIAARSTRSGFTETFINGHKIGARAGASVESELATLRGYVDSAAERPASYRNLIPVGSVQDKAPRR